MRRGDERYKGQYAPIRQLLKLRALRYSPSLDKTSLEETFNSIKIIECGNLRHICNALGLEPLEKPRLSRLTLIRSNNDYRAIFRVDLILLKCIAMPRVVMLIIYIYFVEIYHI